MLICANARSSRFCFRGILIDLAGSAQQALIYDFYQSAMDVDRKSVWRPTRTNISEVLYLVLKRKSFRKDIHEKAIQYLKGESSVVRAKQRAEIKQHFFVDVVHS